jgi:hypothetical protein
LKWKEKIGMNFILKLKSKDANQRIKTDLLERVDLLNAQLKSTANGKEERKQIDLEFLQLKQIITELELKQPSEKVTSQKPTNKDIETNENSTNQNLL